MMNIQSIAKLSLLSVLLSGCFLLERATDEAGGDGDGSGETGGTGGGASSKPLASNWINSNGAFTVNLSSAVIGSQFTATFANPAFSCNCNITMTGSESSGTYVSSCTVASGVEDNVTPKFNCHDYEAPRLNNGQEQECTISSSTSAPYSYTGSSVRFGNCGTANSGISYVR